jgi:hypothetical protein
VGRAWRSPCDTNLRHPITSLDRNSDPTDWNPMRDSRPNLRKCFELALVIPPKADAANRATRALFY